MAGLSLYCYGACLALAKRQLHACLQNTPICILSFYRQYSLELLIYVKSLKRRRTAAKLAAEPCYLLMRFIALTKLSRMDSYRLLKTVRSRLLGRRQKTHHSSLTLPCYRAVRYLYSTVLMMQHLKNCWCVRKNWIVLRYPWIKMLAQRSGLWRMVTGVIC